MTVVGVVADMRRTGFDAPVRYETFRPYTQRVVGYLTLVVRTAGDPLAMVHGGARAVPRARPRAAGLRGRVDGPAAFLHGRAAPLQHGAARHVRRARARARRRGRVRRHVVSRRAAHARSRRAARAWCAAAAGGGHGRAPGDARGGCRARGRSGRRARAGRLITGLLYGVSPYDVATLAVGDRRDRPRDARRELAARPARRSRRSVDCVAKRLMDFPSPGMLSRSGMEYAFAGCDSKSRRRD